MWIRTCATKSRRSYLSKGSDPQTNKRPLKTTNRIIQVEEEIVVTTVQGVDDDVKKTAEAVDVNVDRINDNI